VLYDLIGTERELSQVGWALREFARQLGATVVGALHVTCSDEAEWECGEAFQRWFAAGALPELKPASRAPFRSINLGARYEWGSIRTVDEHFRSAESRAPLKLVVVKINAHVAVRASPEGPEYGWLRRYQGDSACCGSLAALLQGVRLPAIRELAEAFAADGKNRVAVLRDTSRVALEHRALLAAVTSARLQAQRAVLDIQEQRPEVPTVFLVLPCVTINRPGPDAELVVGQFGVDWTEPSPSTKYRGLGDDPGAYRVRHDQGRVTITDDQWPGIAGVKQ